MRPIEHILSQVAQELDWLESKPVFVGGATLGLYLDEMGRSQLRTTYDVDCIIPSITSRTGWWQLEKQLRSRGWAPDSTGPICRYLSPGGAIVDLMTVDPAVLGFSGRWYPGAPEQHDCGFDAVFIQQEFWFQQFQLKPDWA